MNNIFSQSAMIAIQYHLNAQLYREEVYVRKICFESLQNSYLK